MTTTKLRASSVSAAGKRLKWAGMSVARGNRSLGQKRLADVDDGDGEAQRPRLAASGAAS